MPEIGLELELHPTFLDHIFKQSVNEEVPFGEKIKNHLLMALILQFYNTVSMYVMK